MNKLLHAVGVFIAFAFLAWGDDSSTKIFMDLSAAILKPCPETKIETKADVFTAQFKTINLTIHNLEKTGELSPKTHQQVGPNNNGFILNITHKTGPYAGQLKVPQEMRGPYFSTYVDARPTADGKDHYWIVWSLGSRLSPMVRKTIIDALPKSPAKQPVKVTSGKKN